MDNYDYMCIYVVSCSVHKHSILYSIFGTVHMFACISIHYMGARTHQHVIRTSFSPRKAGPSDAIKVKEMLCVKSKPLLCQDGHQLVPTLCNCHPESGAFPNQQTWRADAHCL